MSTLEELKISFGRRVRALRRLRQISQRQLSGGSLSHQTVSFVEKGQVNATIQVLHTIADMLNADLVLDVVARDGDTRHAEALTAAFAPITTREEAEKVQLLVAGWLTLPGPLRDSTLATIESTASAIAGARAAEQFPRPTPTEEWEKFRAKERLRELRTSSKGRQER